MSKIDDLTNETYGYLTVRKFVAVNKNRKALWLCDCICGGTLTVIGSSLKSGNTKSCGCKLGEMCSLANKTHGHSAGYQKTREYRTWLGMIARCENPNDPEWHNYGERGITICERWRSDFQNFYADMGDKPSRLTIDRINVNLGYEPGNCRWATWKEQANNKRVPTHCKRGHPLFGDNCYTHSGKRNCKTCHAAARYRRLSGFHSEDASK